MIILVDWYSSLIVDICILDYRIVCALRLHLGSELDHTGVCPTL